MVLLVSKNQSKSDRPFGSWLRAEMRRQGYVIESHTGGGMSRLSERSGVSLSVVSRVLKGERDPSIETLRRLGNALGYPLEEMLVLAGHTAPPERSPPQPPTASSERPAAPRPTVRDDADERLINALERLPQHKKAVILPLVEAMLDEDEGEND